VALPGWGLWVRARDGYSLGGSWGEGDFCNVLTTSSELAIGTGRELGSGADWSFALGGGGGRVVGITLRGS
jgi:hypothetical protein